MEEKRSFKGIWIPKETWLDKDLSIIEKCLLVEISSLDNERGCFASNKYFSDFFGISERQISKYISRLQEIKKVSVSIIGRNKRSIVIEQKFYQGTNKSSITDRTKVLHNNIDSNTENNTSICENKFSLTENKVFPSKESKEKEISKIIELFKKVSPSLSYGNKTQRQACVSMLNKWSFEQLELMIKKTISIQGEKYAPRATTPLAMWQKIADIAFYLKENKQVINKITKV